MKSKKGFTMVEILAVITIISILLVLLVPSVQSVFTSTKEALRESKISTITSAAENYGNDNINSYQNCTSGTSGCTITISNLIAEGYLEEEENGTIIDPLTDEAFDGKIVLCYDSNNIVISSVYVEAGESTNVCTTTSSTSTSKTPTLSLSSSSGSLYVGGNSATVNILTSGSVSSLKCESSNSTYAICSVSGNTLTVTAKAARKQATTITVSGTSGSTRLSATYTVYTYDSSISIADSDSNNCVAVNTTGSFGLTLSNVGNLTTTVTTSTGGSTTNLSASIISNVLYVTANNANANGSYNVKVTEDNGNQYDTKTINVYTLSAVSSHAMAPGDTDGISLKASNAGTITITSSNTSIVKVASSASGTGSSSITLTVSGTTTYYLQAQALGTATITITGSNCGTLTQTINVTNFALDPDDDLTLYVGGNSKSLSVVSETIGTLSCSSSDSSVATCTMDGTAVEITGVSVGTTTISVVNKDSNGMEIGADSVNVTVKETSIWFTTTTDADTDEVDDVCMLKGSSGVSTLYVQGEGDIGTVSAGTMTDAYWYLFNDTKSSLASYTVSGNSAVKARWQLYLQSLSSTDAANSSYSAGYNTGEADIIAVESNGNKKATAKYHVYEFGLSYTNSNGGTTTVTNNSSITLEAGSSLSLSLTTSNTGRAYITTSSSTIASVSITANDGTIATYNGTGANQYENYTLKITGKAPGTATITVTGATCGTITFTVTVKDTTAPTCSFEGDTLIGYNSTGTITLTCTDSVKISTTSLSASNFTISSSSLATITSVTRTSSLTKTKIFKITYTTSSTEGSFTISLNRGAVSDSSSNSNVKTTSESIRVSKIASCESTYDIGYSTSTNVTACVYSIDTSAGTYGVYISGTGAMKNYTSSSKAPWVSTYGGSIVEVEVADGVTSVGNYAFNEESNIASLTLADSITSIGTYAFYNCSALTSLTLPSSLKTIGSYSFYNHSLTTLTIPSTVTSIGSSSFYGNYTLKTLSFETGTSSLTIDSSAFRYNSISSLTIPTRVTSIGSNAFVNSGTLTTLTFTSGSTLKYIYDYAFAGHYLKSLTIPASVKSIGNYAFEMYEDYYNYESTRLSLSFESGSVLTSIGNGAFLNCMLGTFTLPDSLVSIGSYTVFDLGRSGTTINIPANVTSIGTDFASGCYFRTITVSDGNTKYKSTNGVLYEIDSSGNEIALVKTPDYWGSGSGTITIPTTVTTIYSNAFGGFHWQGVGGVTVYIPYTITTMYPGDFSGFTLKAVYFYDTTTSNKVATADGKYISSSGIIFDPDYTTLYLIPAYYSSSNSYTIPSTVTRIESDAMYYFNSITTIYVPSSVSYIASGGLSTTRPYGINKVYICGNSLLNYNSSGSVSSRNYSYSSLYVLPWNDTSSYSRTIYTNNDDMYSNLTSMYSSDSHITISKLSSWSGCT